jgi:tetratricopeptide (TPR) repeat protein
LFICLFLAGITVAVYWPARHYGIIYYDDPLFTTENDMVKSGLNWQSVWWALSSVVVANWHPVTSLSFVLDHQFFGTNPGAEHLVNVLFHAANAALLFLVLNKMSGATWRSAAVAALFVWHPLRVESVAWISERKDVLCGFFFMLTLWAYARYAQKSKVQSPKSKVFYWLALVFFALGLMSKAMLVTVPFLLVLLDFWPLRRISEFGVRPALRSLWAKDGSSELKNASRPSTLNPVKGRGRVAQLYAALRPQLSTLLLEKWPFFALSAFFCGITFLVQKEFAAMVSFDRLTLGDRISNAVSSYLQYLVKLFWPAKLAVIYPYPKSHDALEGWLIALLLAAVSVLCICQLFRRPYLAVGWFWYLGTMLPVIGLVQVGGQAMADRYTYIPLIGPVISLVWLAAEVFPSRKTSLFAATAIILAAFLGQTGRQLQFWRDTVALAGHNIAVTPENASAYFTLGVGLEHAGETNRAMVCYRVATAIFSGDIDARKNLANLLRQQGHLSAAEQEYNILLALNPNDFATHVCLADVVGHLGRTDEAMSHLNEALRLNPDSTEALNNLAWMLATSPCAEFRDGPRAVALARHAGELTKFEKTIFVGTLAAAYAEAGRFDDAIATTQKAIALAQQNGEQDLLQKNQELLERYRRHQTARE